MNGIEIQRELQAGQDRAQKIIDRIERESKRDIHESLSHHAEIGALRAQVRNLCAELAAYEPAEGSVQIEYKRQTLTVHIPSEQIQVAGVDISSLLSKEDISEILARAEMEKHDTERYNAFQMRCAA